MIIVVSQFLVFLTAPCNHYEEQTFISMRTLFWKNLHSLLLLSIFFNHNIFVFILLLFYVWYPFLSDAFVPFFYIYICFICLFCNFLLFFFCQVMSTRLYFSSYSFDSVWVSKLLPTTFVHLSNILKPFHIQNS